MNKLKIINDPIYGLIRIPFPILYDLIQHPYFQRLRRIKQMGLSHLVYPGAVHSRFHHALGAMHLCWSALQSLRTKSIDISDQEAEACLIAILLHDIGHGPFSHALERKFLPVSHEEISLAFMEALNMEMTGRLDLAISMFIGEYERGFFHQLISSQLDMDRLDYLNRDSFYSGVVEGKIGYDRIITMLSVVKDELVVEEKAVFSVEKYLSSRHFMYWQVYLHRTSLAAEVILLLFVEEILAKADNALYSEPLRYFAGLSAKYAAEDHVSSEMLAQYARLDDIDIIHSLKVERESDDKMVSYLAGSLLDRQLFEVIFKNSSFSSDFVMERRQNIVSQGHFSESEAQKLVRIGLESKTFYNAKSSEIKILCKNGEVKNLSSFIDLPRQKDLNLHYFCAPKLEL